MQMVEIIPPSRIQILKGYKRQSIKCLHSTMRLLQQFKIRSSFSQKFKRLLKFQERKTIKVNKSRLQVKHLLRILLHHLRHLRSQ